MAVASGGARRMDILPTRPVLHHRVFGWISGELDSGHAPFANELPSKLSSVLTPVILKFEPVSSIGVSLYQTLPDQFALNNVPTEIHARGKRRVLTSYSLDIILGKHCR